MITIYKYTVLLTDKQTMSIRGLCKILSVVKQRVNVVLYALVDTHSENATDVRIRVYGTGSTRLSRKVLTYNMEFLATVPMSDDVHRGSRGPRTPPRRRGASSIVDREGTRHPCRPPGTAQSGLDRAAAYSARRNPSGGPAIVRGPCPALGNACRRWSARRRACSASNG